MIAPILSLALLTAPVEPPAFGAETCSFERMLAEGRSGMAKGSPALKRYLRSLLKDAALTLDARQLVDAFVAERDPGLLELLAGALATKASNSENAELLQAVLSRAASDPDPEARAAAVRGLRATGSVEAMGALGDAVNYQTLVRDASPQVRRAAVENLLAEDSEVNAGHSPEVTAAAVRAAGASTDPETTASLLGHVSMEQADPSTVAEVQRELTSASPAVRAGAATALGGVPSASASDARTALIDLYRRDGDVEVRRAALQSLARLGLGSAIPTLQSLRGTDPRLSRDIDGWVQVLGMGFQEWSRVVAEQQRRSTHP